ncbi:hypothetical protein LKO27_14165 [Tessaracoccus sp. OS52]|uniref:anti-sigma factor family protein n=1 Tax=Tessaracoccus sp. OS52 TaxID=2886691 RepID=UPI001D110272|nr:hypothetical protein [Tessaracoccus sp. OS52]MCC2594547.1 hypothetical protein [Tessaracoccus sp. OS52]
MTDRHLDEDELLDVALGSGDAQTRDRFNAHLADCPDCQARYTELDEAMREALVAAPAVAPPAGFEGRVLASPDVAPRLRQRPRAWVPLLAAAAAVVLGLVAGIGGTLAYLGAQPPDAETLASSVLTTEGGDVVGTAALASVDDEEFLLLSITAGRAGVAYDCILVADDGSRTSGGSWELAQGPYGSGGSGVWVVPVPDERPVSVELRVDDATTWARAEF